MVASLVGSFGSIGGSPRPFVSLRTIPILVSSSEGREITATCLLDDGAQSLFITKSLARKLHLKGFHFDYVTKMVDGSSSKCSALYTQVFITSLSSPDPGEDETLDVIEPIQVWAIDDTILEYESVDWKALVEGFPHLEEVDVAPLPSPNIDILLGNDVPDLKICLKELIPPRGLQGPVAHLTPLGWSVIGPIAMYPKNLKVSWQSHKLGNYQDVGRQVFDVAAAQAGSVPRVDMSRVEKLLQMMCHIEFEKESKQSMSVQSHYIIQCLKGSLRFLPDLKQYEVTCTWKPGQPKVLDNHAQALVRLQCLEQGKLRNPEFCEGYAAVFEQWLEQGYIREVPECNWALPENENLYWCHHLIVREDKTTMKVRVVMDGAAKHKGRNINKILALGPNLIANLQSILVCMRLKPMAFTGDISSMFLRIRLLERDRQFHRFIWAREAGDPPCTFKFLSHVFGNVGSPAVANFVVKEHASQHREQYLLAYNTVHRAMVVNDVVDSAETPEDARRVICQLIALHRLAGMELQEWASNLFMALRDLGDDQMATSVPLARVPVEIDEGHPVIKTLGLIWQTSSDTFHFEQSVIEPRPSWMRRKLLSAVARLFHPLGLLAP